MPQLDFREALSTPEEKLFSPAATAAAVTATSLDRERSIFARGARLSRSTLTNIFFVAIASVGGLVCGFYFFNGGDLLRAAASWPNEFLYPRPLSTELLTDKIDIGEQPNPVDQFARDESGSTTTEEAKAPFGENVGPSDFSQPATTIGATNPPVTTPVGPGPTLLPTLPATPSLPGDLGLPSAPGTDSLLQTLYQTATSITPAKTITRTANSTRSSARRKASSAQQKLTSSQTKNASAAPRTMTQNMQQTSNMIQAPMNSIQAPSAMGMSGGLGGGLGGAVGGVGGGLGGGLGGLGGTVGGIVGGHH